MLTALYFRIQNRQLLPIPELPSLAPSGNLLIALRRIPSLSIQTPNKHLKDNLQAIRLHR